VINVGNGGTPFKMKLPDDPEEKDPDPTCGYLKNLELLQYCEGIREDVRKVIEDTYPFIEPKIKDRYGI
jgi:hypothetical protein